MKSALIGYTGFIGSNLRRQTKFDYFYNSKNIKDAENKEYDLVLSTATSSLRWKADLEPDEDWQNIEKLISSLEKIKSKKFILISTVDVYKNPAQVDEDDQPDEKRKPGYGYNRFKLEKFVRKNFKEHVCIRLPQTYGEGLKKNFIFDLIHNNVLDFTHKDSKFQWYSLDNLWQDITVALDNNLKIVNFAVEPVTAWEVAKYTVNMDFKTITDKPPLHYDVHTKYAKLFNSTGHYLYRKEKVLSELKNFIKTQKIK